MIESEITELIYSLDIGHFLFEKNLLMMGVLLFKVGSRKKFNLFFVLLYNQRDG